MTEHMQPLAAGTMLTSGKKKYTIKQVLGAGGFGITYLAESRVVDGNVSFVVKYCIKEHFMSSCFRGEDGTQVHCTPTSAQEVKMSREDFLTEARRLQKICKKSKHIVNVNEAFEANGTAYYVMEYLDGGNPKKMSEAAAVALVLQLAEALKVIHEENLLHLDIKPDNIMMQTDDNGNQYPVLIDFGIAKHFDSSGRATSIPLAKGASIGYAPIEQYDQEISFKAAIDIYALGGVLLYLISGKNPPSAFKVSANPDELKRLIPSDTSEHICRLILEAMAPNVNDRIQSAEQLLARLQGADAADTTETESKSQYKTKIFSLRKNGKKGIPDKEKRGAKTAVFGRIAQSESSVSEDKPEKEDTTNKPKLKRNSIAKRLELIANSNRFGRWLKILNWGFWALVICLGAILYKAPHYASDNFFRLTVFGGWLCIVISLGIQLGKAWKNKKYSITNQRVLIVLSLLGFIPSLFSIAPQIGVGRILAIIILALASIFIAVLVLKATTCKKPMRPVYVTAISLCTLIWAFIILI